MPQDAAAGREASAKSKTEQTIAQLEQLLKATPSAEELIQTWTRSEKESEPRLQDLSRALDAGKVIEKGVPMWIIVSASSQSTSTSSHLLLQHRCECARHHGIKTALGLCLELMKS